MDGLKAELELIAKTHLGRELLKEFIPRLLMKQIEVLEFDPLVIEAQLAHAVKDANGRAYNRTTYIKQRATMMQAWADYLDKLAAGAEVIQFKRA